MNLSANHNIRQIVEICNENEKPQRMVRLLKEIAPTTNNAANNGNKIIIFVETKIKVSPLFLLSLQDFLYLIVRIVCLFFVLKNLFIKNKSKMNMINHLSILTKIKQHYK